MSNRRKLTPQQTAQRDQGLAMARDQARDPHAAVLVTDYAPEGAQCCWCDHPMSAHAQPDYVCGGCPEGARWIVRLLAYTAREAAYPLCEGHYGDAVRTFRGALPGVPAEVTAWEEL